MDKEKAYFSLSESDFKNAEMYYDDTNGKNTILIPIDNCTTIVFDPNIYVAEREYPDHMYDLAFTYSECGVENDMCIFPSFVHKEQEFQKIAEESGEKILWEIARHIAAETLGTYNNIDIKYFNDVAMLIMEKDGDMYIINDVFRRIDNKFEFREIASKLHISVNDNLYFLL